MLLGIHYNKNVEVQTDAWNLKVFHQVGTAVLPNPPVIFVLPVIDVYDFCLALTGPVLDSRR